MNHTADAEHADGWDSRLLRDFYRPRKRATETIELSPAGMRKLRRILRRMGASRKFSGWAIRDLLIFRPSFVDVQLPSGATLRVQLTEHPIKFPCLTPPAGVAWGQP